MKPRFAKTAERGRHQFPADSLIPGGRNKVDRVNLPGPCPFTGYPLVTTADLGVLQRSLLVPQASPQVRPHP